MPYIGANPLSPGAQTVADALGNRQDVLNAILGAPGGPGFEEWQTIPRPPDQMQGSQRANPIPPARGSNISPRDWDNYLKMGTPLPQEPPGYAEGQPQPSPGGVNEGYLYRQQLPPSAPYYGPLYGQDRRA